MLQLMRETLAHFRRTWQKHLAFSVLSLLVTSRLIVPFFSHLIHRLLIGSEAGVLLNRDVFTILLNPRGLLGLVLLMLLSALVIFIELATFLFIVQAGIDGKEVSVSSAVLTALKKLTRLLRLDVLAVGGGLVVLLPFLRLPVKPQLLGDLEPPAILLETIRQSPTYRVLYWSSVALFAYLFLRLLFTLHAMLIERRTPWRAIKRSFALTHQRSWLLLTRWGFLQVVLVLIGVGMGYLLSRVPEIRGFPLSGLANRYRITASALILRIYTLFLMPLSMTFLTLLYRQASDAKHAFTGYVRIHWLEHVERRVGQVAGKRRVLALAFVLLIVFGSFFIGASANEEDLYLGRNVLVAAHRGGGTGPENSLSAIEEAIEAGADTIELDVQITGDGVFVLHHDATLERLAGDGRRIIDLTRADLNSVTLGEGEPLATLEEALVVIGDRADLLLDIKVNGRRSDMALGLIRILSRHERIDRTRVQSFDGAFLEELRRLKPELRIGQILYYALGDPGNLEVDFFSVQEGMLDAALVRRLRENQREIWVWTTDTREEVEGALQHDINGLITKSVPLALEILGREPVGTGDEGR